MFVIIAALLILHILAILILINFVENNDINKENKIVKLLIFSPFINILCVMGLLFIDIITFYNTFILKKND